MILRTGISLAEVSTAETTAIRRVTGQAREKKRQPGRLERQRRTIRPSPAATAVMIGTRLGDRLTAYCIGD